MRYATSKPTGPFIVSITVRHEPRCPGCAEFLQPSVVVFHDGWAWCPVCIAMRLHCEPWIGVVLGNEPMLERCSVVNGLHFYTPDVVNNEALTAFENCRRITDSMPIAIVDDYDDRRVELTPTGSVELARMGKSPPMRTEADMRRDGTLPPLDGNGSQSI